MMKMNWKIRAFLLALSVVLLLPLLSLSVFATEEEESFAEWELSEDDRVLTGDGKVYSLYYPIGEIPFYSESKQIYIYENEVSFSKDGAMRGFVSEVCAPGANSEFVWLRLLNDGSYIYATEAGARQLNHFLSGKSDNYFLRTGPYSSAKLEKETVEAMEDARKASDGKKTVNVSELKGRLAFDVVVYDETQTFLYDMGSVYELSDGKYYYLHLLSLGNQYFDADGNFSYRSGSVELTVLDDAIADALDTTAEDIVYTETVYVWENEDGTVMPTSVFWVFYVFLGILLPIAPLVVGLILPRSKKKGHPKYWYVLSIISAIWIFLAILLMILLI